MVSSVPVALSMRSAKDAPVVTANSYPNNWANDMKVNRAWTSLSAKQSFDRLGLLDRFSALRIFARLGHRIVFAAIGPNCWTARRCFAPA